MAGPSSVPTLAGPVACDAAIMALPLAPFLPTIPLRCCKSLVLDLGLLAFARGTTIPLASHRQSISLLGDVVDKNVGVNGSGGGKDTSCGE